MSRLNLWFFVKAGYKLCCLTGLLVLSALSIFFLLISALLTGIGDCGKLVDKATEWLFAEKVNWLYEELHK